MTMPTEINPVGGEAWGRTRMMSDLEEPVIPENTVLALPHRVAVLLQPGKLATVLSVSPVPLEPRAPVVTAIHP